ncbi:hypothetical protein [Novosphingobium sp. ZW T3_23]|uniref:hypothetical protein n=1 Tax=Novosphingobium sp. ZW T3_23 TaxID=3378084 RepID=UPI003854AD14
MAGTNVSGFLEVVRRQAVRNPIKASIAALAAIGFGFFVAQAVPTRIKAPTSSAPVLSGSSSAEAYDAIRYDPGPAASFFDASPANEVSSAAPQAIEDYTLSTGDAESYSYSEDTYESPEAIGADFAVVEEDDPQATWVENAAASAAVAAEDVIGAERTGTAETFAETQ